MKGVYRMIKKYGWKYFFATVGTFFLGILWPFGFFFCYMFKDEKDEAKRKLIKSLNMATITWFSLQLIAVIGKFVVLPLLEPLLRNL